MLSKQHDEAVWQICKERPAAAGSDECHTWSSQGGAVYSSAEQAASPRLIPLISLASSSVSDVTRERSRSSALEMSWLQSRGRMPTLRQQFLMVCGSMSCRTWAFFNLFVSASSLPLFGPLCLTDVQPSAAVLQKLGYCNSVHCFLECLAGFCCKLFVLPSWVGLQMVFFSPAVNVTRCFLFSGIMHARVS